MRHLYLAPLATLALAPVLLMPPPAAAETIAEIGRELDAHAAEVKKLSVGIAKTAALNKVSSADAIGQRITEAQTNFGAGNYDAAAVVLYDVVESFPKHTGYDTALYYLAEALFQKGDTVASRAYFTKLATERGSRSKYYRQALERLIELTLLIGDHSSADTWLKALDSAPASEKASSVPFVRGRYYHHRGQFARAIAQFRKVAPRSSYYVQARYFLGVSLTASGNLEAAAAIFETLLAREPKNNKEKRVIELTHLAIGRLHYERDQPGQAIDSYLNLSRRSDLFPEALFEASWVYVKNKDFDKALRALELLALSDPNSYRMPEVRILEANLRIRRAKRLESEGGGNPAEEYARARKLFEETRGAFADPHATLRRILDTDDDPRHYLEHITGRVSDVFETRAELPEVATTWVRREPEIKRVISIENDLGAIASEIQQAELTVARLDRALGSSERVNFFPALASKRGRGTEILEKVLGLRSRLASTAARRLALSASDRAELGRLTAARRQVERELAATPGAGRSYEKRIASARGRYDTVDQRRAEVATEVQHAEAQLVALERYVASGAKIPARRRAEIEREMNELRAGTDKLRAELDELERDITAGADAAAGAVAMSRHEAALRRQLRAALDAESRFLSRRARDPASRQVIANMNKANRVAASLDKLFVRIDKVVDGALGEVRKELAAERAKLAAYRKEFANYEQESAQLAGELLDGSFRAVAKKFYEILAQSDVGVVDVVWARQEEADKRHGKLTLDQAREMRTLETDFAEVLRELREKEPAEESGR
jgi:tetratricopeptide (TPR) repeat protein